MYLGEDVRAVLRKEAWLNHKNLLAMLSQSITEGNHNDFLYKKNMFLTLI